MRATLRAISARLIVGHVDRDEADDLLTVVDGRGKPLVFALAEPEGLGALAAVAAGARADSQAEQARWGKLVLETVANETLASPRSDICDAIVDGLRVAHRRLGADGLELIPRGGSGVGLAAVAIVDHSAQIIVVPPAQLFVVHQGIALSVPESGEVGRGIWMRDDLRAEIFAGIGGAHEPDIRVYEASIGPGDSLVLVSSSLARMLTEEDVRQAVTYEEAATGAERLKQLAVQRGVDAGLALIVEIAASLDEDAPPDQRGAAFALPRPALHLEMPPIGSVFSTARDWLLEAVDRAQSTSVTPLGAADEDEDEDIPWPVRGHRGPPLPTASPPAGKEGGVQVTSPAAARPGGPRLALSQRASAAAARVRAALTPPRQEPRRAGVYPTESPRDRRLERFGFGPRTGVRRPARVSTPTMPDFARLTVQARSGVSKTISRFSSIDLAGKRAFIVPVLSALIVLLLVLMGVRTIRGQQARQLQQRFDSLITAAGQLEAQARASGDHAEAQSLIHRAQALVDQAGTLEANQPRVAVLRKDLQSDLDRLDNVVALPDPIVAASFANVGKNISASALAGGSAGLFILDSSGHRMLQLPPRQKSPTPAATKGDKSGANTLGDPKLLASNNGQALILDSNRTLWSYSPAKNALDQIGLKSSASWKDATAMAAYGPNVYILDAALGNIFRYASRDGHFTDAPTRFLSKDDTSLLGRGVSMAIDGAIWVLTSDGQILKLEGGGRQPFTISGLPQPFGPSSQLYTDADAHSLYVLDAANNRIIELAKDGRYLHQYNLSLPSPATGFWPDEASHELFVLTAGNLYQYALPSS